MNKTNGVDLFVGIDFGTTCTGCAYASQSNHFASIRHVQIWPGRAQAPQNKVPTLLLYKNNSDRPSAWGFCQEQHGHATSDEFYFAEYFKNFLDPKELAKRQAKDKNAPKSIELVENWYTDYLKALYNHLKLQLAPTLRYGLWDHASVNFSFSLPTTWTDKNIVEKFRHITRQAGFGQRPNHTVELGLTEAEAAAVYVSTEAPGFFSQGDIALVCDAGGGTTDLSVLRIEDIKEKYLAMRQLDVVSGKTIGSVAIDSDFADLVFEKLKAANGRNSLGMSEEQIDRLAWNASQSAEYQNFKCAFGTADTEDMQVFSCCIRQLPYHYTDVEGQVSKGCVHFDRAAFQTLFDKQIMKLFAHIDRQIERTERRLPNAMITQLVLSGGLGNSTYVQARLRTRYGKGGDSGYSNIQMMQVMVAPEPQLAVCKGLVQDSIQKMIHGQSAIPWRCCRESYGIRCSLAQNERSTQIASGRQAIFDATDGHYYYPDAVHWIVKRGEAISPVQPLKAGFWRTIKPGDSNRTWQSVILVSRTDVSPPDFIDSGDVQELCTITSTLEGVKESEFDAKNKGRLGFGGKKRYFVVNYEVRAVVGPADLRFELWFKGRKVSAANAIKVEWLPAEAPPDENISRGPECGSGELEKFQL